MKKKHGKEHVHRSMREFEERFFPKSLEDRLFETETNPAKLGIKIAVELRLGIHRIRSLEPRSLTPNIRNVKWITFHSPNQTLNTPEPKHWEPDDIRWLK